jgi:galactan 5-O-arabinofuranosyltransferase
VSATAAGQVMRRAATRGRALPLTELTTVLLAALVTGMAVHAVIAASDFDARSAEARGLGPIWAAGMVLIALAAQLVQHRTADARRSRLVVAVLAGAAAGIVMAPLMAGLHGTNQPPNTILGGDTAFHTEYVTRFASTWHLEDYTFRGLDAFYPPAWFWIAGRAADLLGVTPWHVVKPFTILTIGAALLLAFGLWRMVLSPAGALSAAIGSSLVLTTQHESINYSTQAWYSTHSAFVAVTGVAWTAAALCALRQGASRRRIAVLGLSGALLALCYYPLFVLMAFVVAGLALAPAAGRKDTALRVAALFGLVAVLTAVFWVPLVDAVMEGKAAQGHFVRPDFFEVSLGLNGPAALAILALVAIGLLAVTSSSTASRAVAGVLAGTVLYQLVSVTTLVLLHNQLQPHRAVAMMWAAFGAAVPVAAEGLRGHANPAQMLPAPTRRALGGAVLVVATAGIFLLGSAQGADLAGGPYSVAAHRPLGLAQAAATSRFITGTAGKPPQDLTIVTANHAVLVTQPYFGFLPVKARYAHPQADLPERVQVIRTAAACPDAACTARALAGSRFGPVDALVLTRTPRGYQLTAQEDGFPDILLVTIDFRPDAFGAAWWARRDFGAYTAFVRRPR